MKRTFNLTNPLYKRKYKDVYKLIFNADLDEVKDFSNWYRKNQNFVEMKRPLWIILESKILNKRIWITHDFGELSITTAQLDLDINSIDYHNSYVWKKFNNQKEMSHYLKDLLEPCVKEQINELDYEEMGEEEM